MQLSRRMVKPDFWSDTELSQKLPPAGRMLYQGLWQLAEDSGIIENDPVAFKMILFPLDQVQVDDVKDWAEVLEDQNKLIPYESEGKQLYYIKNFHKHQSLRSPAQPELPLPEFVDYIENDEKYRAGGYVIRYDCITKANCTGIAFVGNVKEGIKEQYRNGTDSEPKQNGNGTDSVPEANGSRSATNKNKKENKNKNLNVNKKENKKEKVNNKRSDSGSPNDDSKPPSSPPEENGPKFDEDDSPYQAALYLKEKILENNKRAQVPKSSPQDMEKWATELDRLNRLGPVGAKESEEKGYTWDEIKEIIDWCQDHNFWKSNILSAGKLREQIVKLENQMKNDRKDNGVKQGIKLAEQLEQKEVAGQ